MGVIVGDSLVDLFALPDSELVFGLNDNGRHAVSRVNALAAIGDGLVRDARPFSMCGERVHIAAQWGAYERSSLYLNQGKSANCGWCGWIVAAANNDFASEIARERPEPEAMALFAEVLGDPLAGIRVLEAIAYDDDDDLVDRDDFLGRSPRIDLLAIAAAHQPVVTMCEDCAEHSDWMHEDGPCPNLAVGCMACTAKTGAWAGEWEGYTMPQCFVNAPCSVLRAFADYYKIELPNSPARSKELRP